MSWRDQAKYQPEPFYRSSVRPGRAHPWAHGRIRPEALVRVPSRSIPPPWRSIRFRLTLRTYDAPPWGVRVVSQTKSRKIPTRKILPPFFASRHGHLAHPSQPSAAAAAAKGSRPAPSNARASTSTRKRSPPRAAAAAAADDEVGPDAGRRSKRGRVMRGVADSHRGSV